MAESAAEAVGADADRQQVDNKQFNAPRRRSRLPVEEHMAGGQQQGQKRVGENAY